MWVEKLFHKCVCVVLERMLRQAVRRMSGDVGNAQTALVVNVWRELAAWRRRRVLLGLFWLRLWWCSNWKWCHQFGISAEITCFCFYHRTNNQWKVKLIVEKSAIISLLMFFPVLRLRLSGCQLPSVCWVMLIGNEAYLSKPFGVVGVKTSRAVMYPHLEQ